MTLGCWDPQTSSIVISRMALDSIKEYAGTLIHELIHARTGYPDIDRDFEKALTSKIGSLCANLCKDLTSG